MDNENIPQWADEQLSAQLPVLRAKGENQDLEYKAQFPKNLRDLTKEIAAFATSNEGYILIGVADNGDLVGLHRLDRSTERDALLQRVQGACRGDVRPSITPTIRFAVEHGKAVMVIKVPRGPEPVYYSGNVPYVRHISESRPAEPHEVVELIRARIIAEPTEAPDKFSELLSSVAGLVFDVLMYAEEVDERMMNPWIDQWRWSFRSVADRLREIASDDIALERGIAGDLSTLAASLDEASTIESFIGSGPAIAVCVRDVAEKAHAFKERWIDVMPLSHSSMDEVRTLLSSIARQVKDLGSRAEEMISRGRVEEFQSNASGFGQRLLKISYYRLDQLQSGLSSTIRPIGRKLHLVETMRLYADGGMSAKAMVDTVSACGNELAQIERTLQRSA